MELSPTPTEAFRIAQEISEYTVLVQDVESALPHLEPNKWVAFSKEGDLVASTDDVNELFEKLDADGIERNTVVVRYNDPNPPTLIL